MKMEALLEDDQLTKTFEQLIINPPTHCQYNKLYFINTHLLEGKDTAYSDTDQTKKGHRQFLSKLECPICRRVFHKAFGLEYHLENAHDESEIPQRPVAKPSRQISRPRTNSAVRTKRGKKSGGGRGSSGGGGVRRQKKKWDDLDACWGDKNGSTDDEGDLNDVIDDETDYELGFNDDDDDDIEILDDADASPRASAKSKKKQQQAKPKIDTFDSNTASVLSNFLELQPSVILRDVYLFPDDAMGFVLPSKREYLKHSKGKSKKRKHFPKLSTRNRVLPLDDDDEPVEMLETKIDPGAVWEAEGWDFVEENPAFVQQDLGAAAPLVIGEDGSPVLDDDGVPLVVDSAGFSERLPGGGGGQFATVLSSDDEIVNLSPAKKSPVVKSRAAQGAKSAKSPKTASHSTKKAHQSPKSPKTPRSKSLANSPVKRSPLPNSVIKHIPIKRRRTEQQSAIQREIDSDSSDDIVEVMPTAKPAAAAASASKPANGSSSPTKPRNGTKADDDRILQIRKMFERQNAALFSDRLRRHQDLNEEDIEDEELLDCDKDDEFEDVLPPVPAVAAVDLPPSRDRSSGGKRQPNSLGTPSNCSSSSGTMSPVRNSAAAAAKRRLFTEPAAAAAKKPKKAARSQHQSPRANKTRTILPDLDDSDDIICID